MNETVNLTAPLRARDDRYFNGTGILVILLAFVVYFAGDMVAALYVLFQAIHESGARSSDLIDRLDEIVGNQAILVMLIGAVVQLVVYVVLLSTWLRRRGKPYLFLRAPQARALVAVPLIAVAGVGFTSVLSLLFETLAPTVPWVNRVVQEYGSDIDYLPNSGNLLLTFVTVVIVVPIVEEILFRGIILGELKLFLNKYVAVVVSAVIFGVMHGNWFQGIYACALGITLGLVYVWTESLYMSILEHALFNFLGGFLPTLAYAYLGENTKAGERFALVYAVVSSLLFLLGIPVMIWLGRHRRPGRTVATKSRAYWLSRPEVGAPLVEVGPNQPVATPAEVPTTGSVPEVSEVSEASETRDDEETSEAPKTPGTGSGETEAEAGTGETGDARSDTQA